jgi:hypothetical protein
MFVCNIYLTQIWKPTHFHCLFFALASSTRNDKMIQGVAVVVVVGGGGGGSNNFSNHK